MLGFAPRTSGLHVHISSPNISVATPGLRLCETTLCPWASEPECLHRHSGGYGSRDFEEATVRSQPEKGAQVQLQHRQGPHTRPQPPGRDLGTGPAGLHFTRVLLHVRWCPVTMSLDPRASLPPAPTKDPSVGAAGGEGCGRPAGWLGAGQGVWFASTALDPGLLAFSFGGFPTLIPTSLT